MENHITRAAPEEDRDWLIHMTQQYKQYLKLEKKVKALQMALMTEMRVQAKKTIKKTMRRKKYLCIKK